MESLSHVLVPSAFGTLSIVWQETGAGPKVRRVFLPNEGVLTQDLLQATFPDASPRSCADIAELGERVRRFFDGEAVAFDLSLLALERCSPFQRTVLLAEHGIPRGRVSTYGRIAAHVGVPRGARAVGRALSRNPFPVVIPCHRAIRSDGHLGGFQGGREMKRALLELEGVAVTPAGNVTTDRFYY
jgi:methylated-DNA-[protein]-cysteine S-methyltransferase